MHQPVLVALTLNPAVDLSGEIEKLVPVHKLRCKNERHDPGGGVTGGHLQKLVGNEGLRYAAIPTGGETRENVTVLEATTGSQYRFLFPGPMLATLIEINVLSVFCCKTESGKRR